jgi:methyltransferase-like protein
VAYVSYNTYPGWNLRSVVREVMKYHTARFEDPETKVYQARQILTFMAAASASVESPLARIFSREAGYLLKAADHYLYHEHLEDSNLPLYFHQFVAAARAAGLDYLGEAWHQSRTDDLPPEAQQTLETISFDLIELEQFLDFIRARTFRRTLLCQSENQVVHVPDPSAIEPFLIAPLARPKSDQPDIASDKPEEFELAYGSTATTSAPLLKAALVKLAERFPGAIPFAELFEESCRALKLAGEAKDKATLATMMIRGYVSHLVAVQSEPFPFTTQIGARPRASRLARCLAATGARVPTLRHELAEFSPAGRLILRLADGTRTAQQIAAEVANSNDESIRQELSAPELAGDAGRLVALALARLARTPLLEA